MICVRFCTASSATIVRQSWSRRQCSVFFFFPSSASTHTTHGSRMLSLSVNIVINQQKHSTFVLIRFDMTLAACLIKVMQSDAKTCSSPGIHTSVPTLRCTSACSRTPVRPSKNGKKTVLRLAIRRVSVKSEEVPLVTDESDLVRTVALAPASVDYRKCADRHAMVSSPFF